MGWLCHYSWEINKSEINRNQPIHTIDCKNKLKNKLRKQHSFWYLVLPSRFFISCNVYIMHESQTFWLTGNIKSIKTLAYWCPFANYININFSNEINFLKHFNKHELWDKKPHPVRNSYCVIPVCVLQCHIHNA